jgi:hypothetical protein
MAEEKADVDADAGSADLVVSVGSTSRLQRRLKALERGGAQPETISVLKLLTTAEIRRALALTERGGVLPSGEVRHPEAFREATPGEWEALEHWRKLCGEPLDHLELAEELLDRMGEAHGWSSREAIHAALLLKRLELPDESSWFVGKMADAVLNLYAVLDEHPGEPEHPKVRGAVRRLERLKEIDRIAPGRESVSEENGRTEDLQTLLESPGGPRNASERSERAGPRPGGIQAGEAREPEERRGLWSRLFGG